MNDELSNLIVVELIIDNFFQIVNLKKWILYTE